MIGGTSASSPIVAGIVNAAGRFATSTSGELAAVYSGLGVAANFNDTTTGFCGPYMGYAATKGWDSCTGVGSPNGLSGK